MRLLAFLNLLTMSTATLTTPTTSTSLTHAGVTISTYHLPPHPVVYQNTTPPLTFSPTAFTLISSPHDALLIDAPATITQGAALTAWLHETLPPHVRLRGILVTHGHGDHFFSAPQIVREFDGAKVFASKGVVEHMRQQYEEAFFGGFWGRLFPDGQIDVEVGWLGEGKGVVEVLDEDEKKECAGKVLLHGGHEVRVVQVGQGDTYDSTVVHVPSVGLVVGGDVVYGSCHQLLVEDATPELRQAWRRSLDEVEKLRPNVVVPSHMLPGEGYAPEHVRETRRYIDVWETERAKASTWEELEKGMVDAFPERDGSFILRWSSQAPFGADF